MKKLILSFLTLASLTACKKDIVEPVVENSETNTSHLPQKAISRRYFKSGIISSEQYSTVTKEFTYNADGLLTKVTSYDSANASIVSTLAEFTYSNGKMQNSKQVDESREIYNTYDKDGLLSLTTYKEKNGGKIYKCYYHYDSQNRIDTIKTVNGKDSSAYLNIRYARSVVGEDSVILSPFSVYDWGNDFSILNYGFGYAIKNDTSSYVDKSQGSYNVHYTNKAYNYQRELMEFLLVDMGYNTKDNFPYSPILKAWYKSYYPTTVTPFYISGAKTYEYKFDIQDRLTSIKTRDNEKGSSLNPDYLEVNTTVIY